MKSLMEASSQKVLTSLGFSLWSVLKYRPHCNKTVKVTTPQSKTCTVFCLQFGKQGLDTTDSFGSLYSVLLLIYLHFIEDCIDEICNNHNSRY